MLRYRATSFVTIFYMKWAGRFGGAVVRSAVPREVGCTHAHVRGGPRGWEQVAATSVSSLLNPTNRAGDSGKSLFTDELPASCSQLASKQTAHATRDLRMHFRSRELTVTSELPELYELLEEGAATGDSRGDPI